MKLQRVLASSVLLAVCSSSSRRVIPPYSSVMQELLRGRRETVDLHNGEFCVDVSTYGAVKFEAAPREKCETTFVKNCEIKTEQVCDEVTEIQCDIVPFTDCKMTMDVTTVRSFEMVPKTFFKKECREGMDTVQHTKMMPECRNVTKQNCITKWETDENGNQVWAGNEDCEPVTWRECQLVPRQVDFKVPKIECEDGDEIPYMDCEESEKEQMVSAMVCEVGHSTACKPVTSTKCSSIQYQECNEIPQEECKEQEMMVPMQEKQHKKKCLLPDDGTFSSAGAPAPRQAKAVATPIEGRAEKRALTAEESRTSVQVQRHGRRFQGQVGTPRVQHPKFVQNIVHKQGLAN